MGVSALQQSTGIGACHDEVASLDPDPRLQVHVGFRLYVGSSGWTNVCHISGFHCSLNENVWMSGYLYFCGGGGGGGGFRALRLFPPRG